MSKHARVENGIVVEIIPHSDIPIEKRFTEELVAQMVVDLNDEAVEGGTWDGTSFGPVPITAVTWNNIRDQRERLLTNSDWTALNDAPLTVEDANAWRAYRQALRDIPQTYLNAADVVWPTQPE